MIKYRELNHDSDLSEVITLLSQNLNTRHSYSFLSWKHLDNPFGIPIGAVATIDNVIVGVVFYTRYNFQRKNEDKIRCLRPIDGCTAKIHRGKGILKKLMNYCLELYKNDYDLLMATPNKYSYPEFLKLGWKNLDEKIYYKIGILTSIGIPENLSIISSDIKNLNSQLLNTHKYFVSSNVPGFFKWRYQDSLDSKYVVKCVEVNGHMNYVVYHIKNFKGFRYIVLCDFIGNDKDICIIIKAVCRLERIFLIYYLSNKLTDKISFLITKKRTEARVTIREDNSKLHEDLLFSLPDMSL